MKKLIMIILIILWAGLIFYASSRNSADSNSNSKRLIYNVTKKAITITNKYKLTNISVDDANLKGIVNKFNYPLRKVAHAFVYFVLGILLFLFFKCFNISNNKVFLLVILICFIYSLTDEYHQIYVDGRTAKFIDCLIDTFGTFISCLILYIIYYFKK